MFSSKRYAVTFAKIDCSAASYSVFAPCFTCYALVTANPLPRKGVTGSNAFEW